MYQFEVIDADNPQWDSVIQGTYRHDFYHTAFYHKLDSDYQSLLAVAKGAEGYVALPLVKRPIEGTGWFDLTSAYGYCGPVGSCDLAELSTPLQAFFREQFAEYCKAQNIISVFSRLHPLIEQSAFFKDFGQVVALNQTVTIDLRLPLEKQRSLYQKSNKHKINQLRKRGFTVSRAQSEADIDAFVQIYYETMDRVHAEKRYYFSPEYFRRFLSSPSFQSTLLLARLEDRIVSAGIFTNVGKILQYHLSGTLNDFIRDAPMKLLLDEARLMGTEMNLDFFHLGGGTSCADDDSLFLFKASFSDWYTRFSVWNYIADKERYVSLIEAKNLSAEQRQSTFFPLYRLA